MASPRTKPKRIVNRIVIHTSASHNKRLGVLDPSAKEIDAMHRARGWAGIGYHHVIRRDGRIEAGRDECVSGAGAAFANSDTIHICCSGSGDHEDFTEAQKGALCQLCHQVLQRWGLVDEFRVNPFRIVGHREINDLVKAGIYPEKARTSKSCPGRKVDMRELRGLILSHVSKADGWS